MGEDDHEFVVTPERIISLGFNPQKEIIYNQLLPYARELDDESTRLFEEIKTNLGKAVMIREIRPGCGVWTSRLIKYIKIYGLKFSKEDHINLIKLVYELVTIPELEPPKLHKFATLLVLLIKKKYLITPEELTLPWRPLYDVSKNTFTKSTSVIGMYHYNAGKNRFGNKADNGEDETPNVQQLLQKLMVMSDTQCPEQKSMEATFGLLVKSIKPYFALSATREIMEEVCPSLTLWHGATRDGFETMAMFLPTTLPPHHYDLGPQLWLYDCLDLWQVSSNSICDSDMMSVFAAVAQSYVGKVEWESYVPEFFARFLRSFNLPVGYKNNYIHKQNVIDTNSMSVWIVWTLGSGSSTQRQLEAMMGSLESYFHSANSGRWSNRLRDFLRKLASNLLQRVHKERHPKFERSWENKVPQEYKLTDDDISHFISSILDATMIAVFSRSGASDAGATLQHLATLRPQLVIPPLLEKLWATIDTFTHPHKLTSIMQCIVSVARPLVRGSDNGFPEGPTHVVPLLLCALPGLDPNDIKKTLVSLHFISIFCTLVPLVDCSHASEFYSDLTEEELIVCENSAQLEDFVLQFIDRIFCLIESSTFEQTRIESKDTGSIRSKTESLIEAALASAVTVVLMQSSPQIYSSALRKFFHLSTERIFETKVAGNTMGLVCRAFSRVNTAETLKTFLPYLSESILRILGKDDELLKEERLSEEFLYNMLIFSHVVEGRGEALLPHIPLILQVLDRSLRLTCKEGYEFACEALTQVIISLSTLNANESRSCAVNYDTPLKDFLPIRHWGKSVPLKKANIEWHTPTAEEVSCVQMIMDKYLGGVLEQLHRHVDGSAALSRSQLLRTLHVLQALLCCVAILPMVDEPALELVESAVPARAFLLTLGPDIEVRAADGGNVRAAVMAAVHELQRHMLQHNEDDTKTLNIIAKIWEQVTSGSMRSCVSGALEMHARAMYAAKRALQGRGGGPSTEGLVRSLLGDRALLQHEMRLEMRCTAGVGASGVAVLHALLELCLSRYSDVRRCAQAKLHGMLSRHAYSYRALVGPLTRGLGSCQHWTLKGALYTALGPRHAPLIAKQDWTILAQLLPALVNSKPSEKPSVIRLLNAAVASVQRHLVTMNVHLRMSDASVACGARLLPTALLQDAAFDARVRAGPDDLAAASRANQEIYLKLVEDIVHAASSPTMHWRYSLTSFTLLPCLVSLELAFPVSAVRLFLSNLLHESVQRRKLALRLTLYILKQRKRSHLRMSLDPYQLAGVPRPNEKLKPGLRADNEWVCYNKSRVPLSEETWNEKPYLHHPCMGLYSWGTTVEMYAPCSQQPSLSRLPTEMEEGEKLIYEFFTEPANVDKLVTFLSMEEKKGKDTFNGTRFTMFKSLFRAYGEKVTFPLVERAAELASSEAEASQRCAAEIIAAAARSHKHWPHSAAAQLWTRLTPALRNALHNVSVDTLDDWGTCLTSSVADMDPSRQHWLWELLLASLERGGEREGESSWLTCARIFVLQGALAQQTWRAHRLRERTLHILCRAGYMHHPYQNVRERMGSMLSTLFEADVGWNLMQTSTVQFIEQMRALIQPLFDEAGNVMVRTNRHTRTDVRESSSRQEASQQQPEKQIPSDIVTHLELGRMTQQRGDMCDALPHMLRDNITIIDEDDDCGKLKKIPKQADREVSDAGKKRKLCSLATAHVAHETHNTRNTQHTQDTQNTQNDQNYQQALNLLKTMLKWSASLISRVGLKEAHTELYVWLLPACCLGPRASGADEELATACDAYLALLSHSHHTPQAMARALTVVEQVAESESWWARGSCVGYAQSLLFHSRPVWEGDARLAARVRAFTFRMLQDERVEVREAACSLLTGLLHCGALHDEDALVEEFKRMCCVRGGARVGGRELASRHAGVLGLCACVLARPYAVPARLSELLHALAPHLHGPALLATTLRRTLATFTRTHHDDWPAHKAQLSDEDLEMLQEMNTPPSHYA